MRNGRCAGGRRPLSSFGFIASKSTRGFSLLLRQILEDQDSVAQRFSCGMDEAAPSLSIIVPVFDEAGLIDSFLAHLRLRAPHAELIVVDGASQDGTRAIAKPLADVFISAPRGRASQMNAGAAIATGETLWFLHADSILPHEAVRDVCFALNDPRMVGGCFRLRLPSHKFIYRVSDSLGNLGVDVFGFALGDHGIFCRRTAFRQSAGYPDVPILEDAELYRRLARAGRMRQLSSEIVTSPRSYQKWGPYRTTAVYFCILTLYVLGVPITFLYPFYQYLAGHPTTLPPDTDLSSAKAS
jgi:rSAM/selenodomain-associated transferase 2